MRIEFSPEDLAPLVEQIVAETLRQLEADETRMGDRLTFTQAEAGSLLGVPQNVVRDCRLRNELEGVRVGKRVLYTKDSLLKFLHAQRVNGASR